MEYKSNTNKINFAHMSYKFQLSICTAHSYSNFTTCIHEEDLKNIKIMKMKMKKARLARFPPKLNFDSTHSEGGKRSLF